MLRSMSVAAMTTLLLGFACLADDPPSKPKPKPEMIVDTKWEATPGDRASLYIDGKQKICITIDMFSFEEFVKLDKANDAEGLKQMILKGKLSLVDSGTPVLIIERHTNRFLAGGVHAIELRILDGEQKNKKVWVMESEVKRLVEKPIDPTDNDEYRKKKASEAASLKAKEDAKAKQEEAAKKNARAASLLSAGKNLEKAGKPKAALENYRKIAADFAETPSAKEAGERIKALGGK